MERSAGIIVVRFFEEGPQVLTLRIYRNYDLPKGHIEEGEDPFTAALRETQEEASITDLQFKWGKESITVQKTGRRKKEVTLFLAETTQDAKITPNPETGKYEHHGVRWMDFATAESMLHPYLSPSIAWAKQKIQLVESIQPVKIS